MKHIEDAPCYYNNEEACAWCNGYNTAVDSQKQVFILRAGCGKEYEPWIESVHLTRANAQKARSTMITERSEALRVKDEKEGGVHYVRIDWDSYFQIEEWEVVK